MKISVVMAVYNGTWCIERAIDSALHQTVRPDEILICDDGSTDGTPELVEDTFGPPVQVLRLPHRNSPSARRAGLDRATGDWLAFMDADDVWVPDKLERQILALERHPECRMISSDGSLVSADGLVRASWLSDYFDPVRELYGDLLPSLIERCYILVSSVMVEREAYHAVGGIDPEIVFSHDYELWLRILGRYPGLQTTDPLIQYFTSPGALSRNFDARHRDDLALMRRLERGDFRRDPLLQRRAAERAAALEYKIGLNCLRQGQGHDGRAHMRRAMMHGSTRQRLLAIGGSFVPDWAIRGLRRVSWLKRGVAPARPSTTLPQGSRRAVEDA